MYCVLFCLLSGSIASTMVAVGSRRGALAFIVFEIIKLVVGQSSSGCGDTFDDELVINLVAANVGGGSIRLEDGPEGYRFRAVCLAAGTLAREGRYYTHASLVVFHSINGSEAVYGQYEFECDVQGINGTPLVWSAGFPGGLLGTSGSDNRLFPLLQPPPPRSQSPAVDCIACVNPAHSSGGSRANADPASHCLSEFLIKAHYTCKNVPDGARTSLYSVSRPGLGR